MLSAANRALVDRDPELPGLAILLDPEALEQCLAALDPGQKLDSVRLTYLRYKRGRSCLAGYEVSLPDGDRMTVSLTARRRDADDKFNKIGERPTGEGPFGPGVLMMPDKALVLASFPADPALRYLARLTGPRGPRVLKRMGLALGTTLRTLRYRPGRRYVAQAERAGRAVAVVKLHRAEAFARALANSAAFTSAGPLLVPGLIGSNQRTGTIATEWLEGTAPGHGIEVAARIGAALAALHRQDPAGLVPLPPAALADSAHAVAADIAELLPPLGARAAALAARIAAALPDGAPMVAVHGDCHLEQFLLCGERVGLVDFDEAARGSASWDIGNLLAHRALDLAADCDDSAFAAGLIGGYRGAGGEVDPRAVAAHKALGLIRLALRPFRRQDEDWPAGIAAVLDRAEDACPAPLPGDCRGPIDPSLPQLAEALDPAAATRAMAVEGLEVIVTSARLVRHKPGRRALVLYEASDAAGLTRRMFGKLRAKGADSRVYALQRELWDEGLRPDSLGPLSVPEPVALVPGLAMWLQGAVDGAPMTTQSCPPERAAAAIGALHAARTRPLRRHTMADEIAILETRLDALAARHPEWAARIARLAREARARSARATKIAPRPIHRDFYHDHLVETETGCAILDLDLFCLGDPAVDIGNFSAHLTERALRETGDPHREAWWQDRFVTAACRSGSGALAGNVAIYEFLSLLRLVEIADRMAERHSSAPALLAFCEQLAASRSVHLGRPV